MRWDEVEPALQFLDGLIRSAVERVSDATGVIPVPNPLPGLCITRDEINSWLARGGKPANATEAAAGDDEDLFCALWWMREAFHCLCST